MAIKAKKTTARKKVGVKKKPSPKKKRGAPAHRPTGDSRRQVELLASYGLPYGKIATCIGISQRTLDKYYEKELETGRAKGDALVASWAFDSAKRGSVPMRIFLCKVRLRWTEREKPEPEDREFTVTFKDPTPAGYDPQSIEKAVLDGIKIQ